MCRRHLAALALAGALIVVAAACSESDGRTLPPPDPARSTTSTSTPSIGPATNDANEFTLRSTAFSDGAVIPQELTCTGTGESPDLSWTGIPSDADTLAIVVRDLDAAGFVHWIVTAIDPFVQGIGQGGVPENAVEVRNESGALGWLPPCPPAGSGTHTYELALLALPAAVDIPVDATAEQAATLLEASAGERAVLTGTVTAGG